MDWNCYNNVTNYNSRDIMRKNIISAIVALICCTMSGWSQMNLRPYLPVAITDTTDLANYLPIISSKDSVATDSIVVDSPQLLIDRADFDSIISTPQREYACIAAANFRPVVFDTYHYLDSLTLSRQEDNYFPEVYYWLTDMNESELLLRHIRQRHIVENPRDVKYNQAWMPEVPKSFRAYIDPVSTKIKFEELKVDKSKLGDNLEANIDKKKWIHTFDASLQFSQAYISPNWYQGGNNNLNMIGHVIYNVKLNQKFNPKYLFEATVQYKLGFNNAPDDSIHSVNITEDLFQANITMGLKAARRWFYSANVMFKTQLLNSYPTNSRDLKSAFLSPGELNVGLGMTYNYTNQKKTLTFGASISPLSWNMKTCTNSRLDETSFDILPGRNTKNKIGSSAECTLEWKLAYNIMYRSRLFAFTDYDYLYGDWEHTIDFNINKYLTTRLYVHMRYDTKTPRVEDSAWRKFQLKEIFSFGFAYHFGTI